MIVLPSVRRLLTFAKPTLPASPLPVPDLSYHHWVSGWPPVAHAYRGGGSSLCAQATVFETGYLASTDEVRRLGVHREARIGWCAERACFPGRRCRVCGVPSGALTECALCLAASIRSDKAIERAS